MEKVSASPPATGSEDGGTAAETSYLRLPMRGNFAARQLSARERRELGKAHRKAVPRQAHALYQPSPGRADPVEVIAAQNATRIASLVPVRMARMAASPFAFLRGSAIVMAADLAGTPSTGIEVVACGDMHLANFGLFALAERKLMFAINDFDEVHPGPWEWDVKRLAASAAVAAAFVGGDRARQTQAAFAAVKSYTRQMQRYAEMAFLDIWYDLIEETEIMEALPGRLQARAGDMMRKARDKGHQRSLDRLTEEVDGQWRIIEDPPLIVRETHTTHGEPVFENMDARLRAYRASLAEERQFLISHYSIVDVARKVVGVGSVGTSCWIVLLQGAGAGDPLFLQVKEARQSVLAPYAKTRGIFRNPGRRVVTGQRMIQGSPDIFLGWASHPHDEQRGFYVRQLSDMKGSLRFSEGEQKTLEGLDEYCALCGWALALAHAKSGDPARIAGYCGRGEALPDAISTFALAYQEQTMRDHEALLKAIRSGRLPGGEEASGMVHPAADAAAVPPPSAT